MITHYLRPKPSSEMVEIFLFVQNIECCPTPSHINTSSSQLARGSPVSIILIFSEANPMQNNTLYGKMFVDANKAYRGVVNIGLGSNTLTTLETDAKMLENKAKSGNFNVAVGGGIEMRRGSGRLQGVYGPMAMISFGSSSTENTYGNQVY